MSATAAYELGSQTYENATSESPTTIAEAIQARVDLVSTGVDEATEAVEDFFQKYFDDTEEQKQTEYESKTLTLEANKTEPTVASDKLEITVGHILPAHLQKHFETHYDGIDYTLRKRDSLYILEVPWEVSQGDKVIESLNKSTLYLRMRPSERSFTKGLWKTFLYDQYALPDDIPRLLEDQISTNVTILNIDSPTGQPALKAIDLVGRDGSLMLDAIQDKAWQARVLGSESGSLDTERYVIVELDGKPIATVRALNETRLEISTRHLPVTTEKLIDEVKSVIKATHQGEAGLSFGEAPEIKTDPQPDAIAPHSTYYPQDDRRETRSAENSGTEPTPKSESQSTNTGTWVITGGVSEDAVAPQDEILTPSQLASHFIKQMKEVITEIPQSVPRSVTNKKRP